MLHICICTFDSMEMASVECMRDLSVDIDANLKFHSHSNSCVLKANHVLSVIAESFINLRSDMLCTCSLQVIC